LHRRDRSRRAFGGISGRMSRWSPCWYIKRCWTRLFRGRGGGCWTRLFRGRGGGCLSGSFRGRGGWCLTRSFRGRGGWCLTGSFRGRGGWDLPLRPINIGILELAPLISRYHFLQTCLSLKNVQVLGERRASLPLFVIQRLCG
jgi:hypothetical protein